MRQSNALGLAGVAYRVKPSAISFCCRELAVACVSGLPKILTRCLYREDIRVLTCSAEDAAARAQCKSPDFQDRDDARANVPMCSQGEKNVADILQQRIDAVIGYLTVDAASIDETRDSHFQISAVLINPAAEKFA
jgi:hypothetical protein